MSTEYIKYDIMWYYVVLRTYAMFLNVSNVIRYNS